MVYQAHSSFQARSDAVKSYKPQYPLATKLSRGISKDAKKQNSNSREQSLYFVHDEPPVKFDQPRLLSIFSKKGFQ
jgi:hypothetical protein